MTRAPAACRSRSSAIAHKTVYDRYKGLGTYGTLGLEIVLSILFPSWLGHWADEKLHSRGWLMLVGFGFGVAAAIVAIIRTNQQLKKELEEQDRRMHENDRNGDERDR